VHDFGCVEWRSIKTLWHLSVGLRDMVELPALVAARGEVLGVQLGANVMFGVRFTPYWSSCVQVLVCTLFLLTVPHVPAQAYSCGDPNSNHCYGAAIWQLQPEYFGLYAEINLPSMGCPSGCGGFVDDEIWLIDAASSVCTSNQFKMCWVEAGYLFEEGSSDTHFFWADARPGTGNTFNLHILGSASPFGAVHHFMIIKDGRGASGVFQVWIYSGDLGTLYHQTSTSNGMTANRVIIGQELAGSSGAFAGTAHFRRNIWAVQALGQEYVFWYNAQTTAGNLTNAMPPFASWAVVPSASSPPEGGDFTTRCCSPPQTGEPPPRHCTGRCCGFRPAPGQCIGECVPSGRLCP